ncbi:NADP-dependent malic enzyme [Bacteroidota bacterium]
MAKTTKEEALLYHSSGRPGKIEVIPTKPYATQRDLSLAYSPGVAIPCLEIEKNPQDVYKYTAKGNLVAVISNGTAVLGLGDIGAEAGKPVMEGKGLLFKVFADIDVFDIEIDVKDQEKMVEIIKAIAPTFGGINLEDIKAPECFYIEDKVKEALNIPVMHDDQHGTAIISAAGMLNALELVGKKIDEIKVVVSGAGASAVSCTRLYISMGVLPENVVMVDSKGVINKKRTDLNHIKKKFITDRDINTLEEAMVGSDLFLGLSIADQLTPKMLLSMAKEPVVFAMANPDPEISYDLAMKTRDDLIFATGRSDHPNQINNVLGFPFIFRGALDVSATAINEEMKIAAAFALAKLAKEPVPESVNAAYNEGNIVYGKQYIIPKPLDPRLILTIAPAVAKAAMDSGVATKPIKDWDAYNTELSKRMGLDNKLVSGIITKAQKKPMKVVFADADNFKVLKAVQQVVQEEIAYPVLIGKKAKIEALIAEDNLDIDVPIIDIGVEEQRKEKYAKVLYEKRKRKGFTYEEALEKMNDSNYFGISMVESGDADAFISGFSSRYADVIRPAIQIVGPKPGVKVISGMYIMMTRKGPYFFGDPTVNVVPSTEELVDITLSTAEEVKKFGIEPVIAMVSFSNFGAYKGKSPDRMQEAIKILHRDHPEIIVDGELQANFALNTKKRMKQFPFTKLGNKDVNTLIFPNLSSGNIAYKMMQEIGESEAIGPVLLGMKKPIHPIQIDASVREIVNMTAIAVVDAQNVKG